MIGYEKRDRWSLSLLAAAVVVGAGATVLALAWAAKAKSPEKLLERCDSALSELQYRLDHLQAA